MGNGHDGAAPHPLPTCGLDRTYSKGASRLLGKLLIACTDPAVNIATPVTAMTLTMRVLVRAACRWHRLSKRIIHGRQKRFARCRAKTYRAAARCAGLPKRSSYAFRALRLDRGGAAYPVCRTRGHYPAIMRSVFYPSCPRLSAFAHSGSQSLPAAKIWPMSRCALP